LNPESTDDHRVARRTTLLVFGVLLAIEATYFAPEQGILRAAAAWGWIACAAIVLGSALASNLRPFVQRGFWSSRDVVWYLVAYFLPVALVAFGATGYLHTQINDEAIQQVAAGLGFLDSRRDLGLFSTGFVGYPARQYLLAALPSLAFGRSLVALRLGFGGLYLIGYLSFLCAARGYLEARKSASPMLLAALGGVLAALGSYPLLYARLFEQTTVPVAAIYLFLAGLLRTMSRPGPLGGLWILWSLGFMPYAYTPALSGWVFGMAVLAYLGFAGTRELRLTCGLGLLYGAAALAVSSLAQVHASLVSSRFSIGSVADSGNESWSYRLSTGLHAAFGLEESLVPAPLVLGLLFVLGQSLRKRDWRVPGVCLWAGATVVLSLLMKGYWRRVPEFDIQRAMVVLPPLSLALVLGLASRWDGLGGNPGAVRGIVMSAILFMALNAAYLPMIRRAPRTYVPSDVTDKEEATLLVVRAAGSGARTVYVVPPLFIHLEDTLRYFSPSTRVIRGSPPAGEHVPGNYVVSYAGTELFVPEDPYALYVEHPVRFSRPRPYLRIAPE
jgi:hypothetical protein